MGRSYCIVYFDCAKLLWFPQLNLLSVCERQIICISWLPRGWGKDICSWSMVTNKTETYNYETIISFLGYKSMSIYPFYWFIMLCSFLPQEGIALCFKWTNSVFSRQASCNTRDSNVEGRPAATSVIIPYIRNICLRALENFDSSYKDLP